MSSWPPGVADFQAYFVRDFAYGTTPAFVQSSDITRGLTEAGMVFNTGLWIDATEKNVAYLYAAAHFMVLNIQGAGGLSSTNRGLGVNNAGGGTIESKSVGGVSVGYAMPDFVRQSPILSQFMRTGYGQTYLQLMTPRLVGNVGIVSGGDQLPAGEFGTDLTPYGGSSIAPLTITTLELPAGVQAVAYSQTLVAVGGVSPMTWALSDGTLPTGLAISSAGVLSGTPSAPGTYYFSVTVTDHRGAAAAQNYQVVIS